MGFLRKYLFPALRRIIFPILFGVVFFNLFKHRLPKFKVLSPLETIDLLKKGRQALPSTLWRRRIRHNRQQGSSQLPEGFAPSQKDPCEDLKQQEHLRGHS